MVTHSDLTVSSQACRRGVAESSAQRLLKAVSYVSSVRIHFRAQTHMVVCRIQFLWQCRLKAALHFQPQAPLLQDSLLHQSQQEREVAGKMEGTTFGNLIREVIAPHLGHMRFVRSKSQILTAPWE